MNGPLHPTLAARARAGALLLPDLATVEVAGPDRVRFLDGMVSSAVAALEPGMGQLAVKPSHRGRVEAVVRVRALHAALHLDVDAAVAGALAATLERFVIMDDCAVRDVSAAREVVRVLGPAARSVLGAAGFPAPPADLPPYWSVRADGVVAVRDDRLGLPGVDLLVPAGQGEAALARVLAAGATPLGADDLEVLRVEAGVPRAGRELDDDTLPMEARLEAALDSRKGCYVGQEVIARATNLGGVKHILVGLALDGEPGALVGASLWPAGGERETGTITSAVRSPALGGRVVGLAFVRRLHEAPGTALEVRGLDGARSAAEVLPLPLVPPVASGA
jgi:folate-binding protein YgfZ